MFCQRSKCGMATPHIYSGIGGKNALVCIYNGRGGTSDVRYNQAKLSVEPEDHKRDIFKRQFTVCQDEAPGFLIHSQCKQRESLCVYTQEICLNQIWSTINYSVSHGSVSKFVPLVKLFQ